jgi:hypothetical protein
MQLEQRRLTANGVDLAYLTCGSPWRCAFTASQIPRRRGRSGMDTGSWSRYSKHRRSIKTSRMLIANRA